MIMGQSSRPGPRNQSHGRAENGAAPFSSMKIEDNCEQASFSDAQSTYFIDSSAWGEDCLQEDNVNTAGDIDSELLPMSACSASDPLNDLQQCLGAEENMLEPQYTDFFSHVFAEA